MSLTEQELLLLDCFMYSDIAPKSRENSMEDIIESFKDNSGEISLNKIKESGIDFSGDMDAKKFKKILEDMDKSDSIKRLEIKATTEEYYGSIRAACFVDPTTGKATVAFRGTGGSYFQWKHNFEGYGDLSQQAQTDAANFINSLPYDNIDVTGHSNGGNQAMYVAIVCGDKIDRCLVYEGQGFSKEFLAEYAEEIRKHRHKIKNICAEKDFVNPLMIDISGEKVYVKSDSKELIFFSHGIYGIYTANKDALESNGGKFPKSAYVEQAHRSEFIKYFTTYLALYSEHPVYGPVFELLSDFLGIVVALIISKKWKDPEFLIRAFKDLISSINNIILDEFREVISVLTDIYDRTISFLFSFSKAGDRYAEANPLIVVDPSKLDSYASQLKRLNNRIDALDRRLDNLYLDIGMKNIAALMKADMSLDYSYRLKQCELYLSETAYDFRTTEATITRKSF